MILHFRVQILRIGLSVLAIGGATACSSSSSGPEDGGDACATEPVWTAASLTFSFTSSGGFVGPPPPDAGCTAGVSVGYDFSKPGKLLARHGCRSSGPVDRSVQLTDAEVAAIVANLTALRTTCNRGCGADAPDLKLIVRASGIETTFNSDFYAGCAFQSPLSPPFVAFDKLSGLESLLEETIAGACDGDGEAADASRCGYPGSVGSDAATAD